MPVLAQIYRNQILESQHHGHIVVMHSSGDVLLEVGEADRVIFPRSSCKMIQALPLYESGAAKEFDLSSAQLALACASHNGEDMHVNGVKKWLAALDLDVLDLRCGPQPPARTSDRLHLHDNGQICTRAHNNCSGKHTGFLALNKHIHGGSEYHELDHPIQKAVREAFEDLTEETSTGYGIDGCGAPNFTTSLKGLARAMASYSKGERLAGVRGEAMERYTQSMMSHPLLVAGTNRCDSELMSAASGKAVVKVGAEAVHIAILPELEIGVALKIEDGATRASECAIAAILVQLGVLEASHPSVKKFLNPAITNFSDQNVGEVRISDHLKTELRRLNSA